MFPQNSVEKRLCNQALDTTLVTGTTNSTWPPFQSKQAILEQFHQDIDMFIMIRWLIITSIIEARVYRFVLFMKSRAYYFGIKKSS